MLAREHLELLHYYSVQFVRQDRMRQGFFLFCFFKALTSFWLLCVYLGRWESLKQMEIRLSAMSLHFFSARCLCTSLASYWQLVKLSFFALSFSIQPSSCVHSSQISFGTVHLIHLSLFFVVSGFHWMWISGPPHHLNRRVTHLTFCCHISPLWYWFSSKSCGQSNPSAT